MKNEMVTKTSPELAQPVNDTDFSASGGTVMKVPKRSVFQMLGGTLSLLCAAQLFVACQPNSGGGASGTPGAANTANSPVQGTGDTGGGNGLHGKVFEAYAVDITKTREWINHVGPIQKHLDSLSPGMRDKEKDFLGKLARRKTWFLAPVRLGQIQKDNLGVNFISDPVQQFALQDDKSIWIDSDLYKANTSATSERDRATLLAHEVFVFIYTFKFMPWKELCFSLGGETNDCMRAEVPKSFEPETKRPLTSDDYKRIRAMTDWYMNQATVAKSENEVFTELIRNGFDSRVFNVGIKAPNTDSADLKIGEEVKIDLVQQYKALANASVLHRIPQTCTRLPVDDQRTDCQVSVEIIETPGISNVVKMSFNLNINGKSQSYVAYRIIGTEPLESILYRNQRPLLHGETALWQTFGYAMPVGTTLTPGQDFYDINIGWNNDRGTVLDLQLSPRRITKVTPQGEAEYRGYVGDQYVIEYGVPHGKDVKQIIFSEPESLAYARNFIGYDLGNGVATTTTYVLNPRPGKLTK